MRPPHDVRLPPQVLTALRRLDPNVRRWVLAVVACVALAAGVLAAIDADVPALGGDSSPSEAVVGASPPTGGASTGAPTPGAQIEVPDTSPTIPTPTTPPPASEAPRGALVMWARGDLTPDVVDSVAALPEVVAAAHVRSSTLGVVESRAADGTVVESLAEGYRIPVTVAAVDPSRYAATLPPSSAREAILHLSPGDVLLSEAGSRLRGVGGGGQIDLESLPNLDVVDVVPDDTVGSAEIMLHVADADSAGLDQDGTIHLLHDAGPGTPTDELIESLVALVPEDVTPRVVDVAAGQPRRRAPLVLSLAEVKERFGEFAFRPREGVREIDIDPSFADTHIVTVDVPILGTVTCHRDIVGDLRGALEAIVGAGLADEIEPDRYAGCYYPRRIATSGDRLSRHSWGIALDINVDLSLPDLGPPPHPGVIAAFETHGFRWGGQFLRPDNHHFEWVGEVTGRSVE